MRLYVTFLFIILVNFTAKSEVAISNILGSHAVVQRGEVFTIKGTSTRENTVKIIFDGKTRNAICKDKKWSVSFPPQEAGGPYTIRITGENEIFLEDIFFGDVFLCSGQSNMEWSLEQANNPEKEVADTHYPLIRMFTVSKDLTSTKKEMLTDGEWLISTPETAKSFSAIGYIFGRSIHNSQNIPIGLINNAWGGSEIDPYMDKNCFYDKQEYLESIDAFKNSGLSLSLANEINEKWKEGIDRFDFGVLDSWQKPSTNRKKWESTTLPGHWEENIWPGFDGVGWYAKTFIVDKLPKGNITVNLEQIDDSDYSYINGQLIGSTINAYSQKRAYSTDGKVLKLGENTIVIRMIDYLYGGGLSGKSEDINIEYDDVSIPLAGAWKAKKGTEGYDKPKNLLEQNTYPTSKYNPMVHPLINTKLSGILWYQGESDWNATKDYAWKSIRMINDYRNKWKQPDLPFLFVQLANWTQVPTEPIPANWGEIRQSQEASLSLSNTAMVTAIDIGEAEDIHPRDKQTVAKRLVDAAQAIVYGKEQPYRSPTMKNIKLTEEGYQVTFDFVGEGLQLKEGATSVNGFAILKNGKMQYVEARIIAPDQVLIPVPNPSPTMVRFLWADNPGEITLYNSNILPALPFQFFAERK